MKRPAAFASLALMLLVGVAAALAPHLASSSFYTDAGSIHEPAADARPRTVLWLPATPVPGPPASADEYEPRLSADGTRMVLVRGKPGGSADLFQRRWSPDGWSEPQPIATINTAADELGPELSRDGQRLYFYSDREGSLGGYDIFVAHLLDGAWGSPVNLGPRVNSSANDFGPALSPDGRSLFFASNRPRDGEAPRVDAWSATIRERRDRHDYDLFRVDLDSDAEPTRLAALNTSADEGAPAISPAGDFLYFSSDRPGGIGGFDLFRARLRDDLPDAPNRLDASINSPFNDLDPALSSEGFRLFFSSDRPRPSPQHASAATPSGHAAPYSLWTSASREVFLDRRPLSLVATLAALWQRSWPWILALALTLAALLAALLLARHPDLRDRYSKLGLLARCLVASLLIHMLLLSLLAFWRVGNALGDALAANPSTGAGGGHRVSLASPAHSAIAEQIMGSLIDAAPTEPLTADPRSSALSDLRPLESAPISLSIAHAAPPLVSLTLHSPEAAPISASDPSLPSPRIVAERLPAASDPAAPIPEPTIAPPSLRPDASAAELASRPLIAPSSSAPIAPERTPAAPVSLSVHDSRAAAPAATPSPAFATPPLTFSAQPSLPPAPAPAALATETAPAPSLPLAQSSASPPSLGESVPPRATTSPKPAPMLPAAHAEAPAFVAATTEAVPSPSAASLSSATSASPDSAAVLAARLLEAPPTPPGPFASASAPPSPASAREVRPSPTDPAPLALGHTPATSRPNTSAPLPSSDLCSLAPSRSTGSRDSPATPASADVSLPAIAASEARLPALEPDPPPPSSSDLSLRDPALRDQILESVGGTKETERAVALALGWLARHQARDGRFSGQHFDNACGLCDAPAEVRSDVAMTGLALLCFLGAGHIHSADGPHRDHVARALAWLIAGQRPEGDLRRGETLYSQSVAAVALCEAFAMSSDPRIGDAARRAVRFLDERASRPSDDPADTAVLGWQLMAVHSARRCGFQTSSLTIERARRWLAQVDQGNGRSAYTRTGPASPAATAEAMVVRQLLGHQRDEPAMQAAADFILTSPPAWDGGAPTYYWYYATLALFQQQGTAWTHWNERLAPELLHAQRSDGPAAGSWDPKDQWSRLGGRIYQTAICTLSLEVYYRYKPVGLDLLPEPRAPEPR